MTDIDKLIKGLKENDIQARLILLASIILLHDSLESNREKIVTRFGEHLIRAMENYKL